MRRARPCGRRNDNYGIEGWPGWGHLGYATLLGLAVTLWFALFYYGMNYVTSLHNDRVRLHFDDPA